MDKPYTFITDIAGLKYYDYKEADLSYIESGAVLHYICEEDNVYDKYAVLVEDDKGRKLGYIKQGINRVFSEVKPTLSVVKLIPSSREISDIYIRIDIPPK